MRIRKRGIGSRARRQRQSLARKPAAVCVGELTVRLRGGNGFKTNATSQKQAAEIGGILGGLTARLMEEKLPKNN